MILLTKKQKREMISSQISDQKGKIKLTKTAIKKFNGIPNLITNYSPISL